jgi:hypothetical protein
MNISSVSKYLSEESKYQSPKAAIKKSLAMALMFYGLRKANRNYSCHYRNVNPAE